MFPHNVYSSMAKSGVDATIQTKRNKNNQNSTFTTALDSQHTQQINKVNIHQYAAHTFYQVKRLQNGKISMPKYTLTTKIYAFKNQGNLKTRVLNRVLARGATPKNVRPTARSWKLDFSKTNTISDTLSSASVCDSKACHPRTPNAVHITTSNHIINL